MSARKILLLMTLFGCVSTPMDNAPSDDDTDTDTDADVALSDECLFGETTTDLLDSPLVILSDGDTYASASAFPTLTAQQFMVGMEAEGYADFNTVEEAFTYVDDTVLAFEVTAVHDGADYAWLKWYAGDTEVGYFFEAETTQIVATVGDGDISACTAMAPK